MLADPFLVFIMDVSDFDRFLEFFFMASIIFFDMKFIFLPVAFILRPADLAAQLLSISRGYLDI